MTGSLLISEKGLRSTQAGTTVWLAVVSRKMGSLTEGARPRRAQWPACLHGLPVFHMGGRKGFNETHQFYCFIKDACKRRLLPASVEATLGARASQGCLLAPAAGTSPTTVSHPRCPCACSGEGEQSLRIMTGGPEGRGLPRLSPCPPAPQQAAHHARSPVTVVSWPVGWYSFLLLGTVRCPGRTLLRQQLKRSAHGSFKST